MAIIQISKVQARSGNLVDLPQLDQGEFGWASDYGLLYIGKTATGANVENIEVLTSYSNISFSQVDGAKGNLNISNSAANGQVLAYDGSNWVNRGGNAGGLINLGSNANVQISGGGIGYVLQTDGTGNLSWTPKGTLYTPIINLTNDIANGNVITMTVANTTPYINGQSVTISGGNISNSTACSYINGNTFYVKLDSNFTASSGVAGSGNVTLYKTGDLASGNKANGSGLTSYVANSATATAVIIASGGTANAAGSAGSIQFNTSGILDGSASLTWTGSVLNVSGNANVSNLNSSGIVTSTRFTSNVGTGTAPLTVTSTTEVANLFVYKANIAQTVTTAAQPNITSTGTLTSLSVSGNANIGNIGTAGLITATGNLNAGNIITAGIVSATGNGTFGNVTATLHVGNLSGTGNSNVGNIGGTGAYFATLSATGNANVGNLGTTGVFATTLSSTGNANVGNLGTAGLITATGNLNAGNIITAGIVSATGNGTFGNVTATLHVGNLSGTGNSNVGNIGGTGAYFTTLSGTGNANVGNIGATNFVGTISTASQTNITAVGTLASLSVTANANIGNIGTTGLVTATGNVTAGNLLTGGVVSATGNANVGNLGTGGLITATGNITGANIITGGLVSAGGNITAANSIISSYNIHSIGTGIIAAGTTQGTATALTKEINVVSTVASGANGVVLPTAIAGMILIINNTTANSLNVYPAANAIINTGLANAAFTHVAGASLQYYATSSTQWYTVGATYA